MTSALSTWALYLFAFAALANFAAWSRIPTRWRGIAVGTFVLAAALSLPAALMPLSHAAPWKPPAGKYSILGARIDVPDATSSGAIWVMLDIDGEPRLYKLPYTTSQANELQGALDGKGGATATVPGEGSQGGVAYDGEEPVTGDDDKQVETPLYNPTN